MLPLFLDISDRLAVVVGGGAVGQRKTRAILQAGGKVRLVALEPIALIGERLEWRTEPYEAHHLDGAYLVFAAATPEVNHCVVADAKARGLWVNCAHEPAAGNCFLPSSIHRGEFTLAVGTLGAAPALARRVRERLEAEFDDAFGTWVRLLAEIRSVALAEIAEPERRRVFFEHIADWAWLERLRRDGEEAVRNALRHELRRAAAGLLE